MTDLDDEMQRARESIKALKSLKLTGDEARKRSCEVMRLSKFLTDASRRTVTDAIAAAAGSNRSIAPMGANPDFSTVVEKPELPALEETVERRAPIVGAERRAVTAEVRAKGRRLEGYAATFGAEARIADFTETIAPGAFADSLAERGDVLALLDHNPGAILGRTRSGTLRLKEDSRGLAFDLDVPDTTHGRDVLALAERGDLGGMSFAFTVKRERWDGERRTLESVNLHEVSIVQSFAAYPDTLVQARARPVFFPRVAIARRYLESL